MQLHLDTVCAGVRSASEWCFSAKKIVKILKIRFLNQKKVQKRLFLYQLAVSYRPGDLQVLFAFMKPPILLIEALKIMDQSLAETNPRAFEIVFCTADKRRDTGGERIIFDRAKLVTPRKTASIEAKGRNQSTREKRFPIKVRNISSDEIRNVNIDLIEELNGHPIL